MELTRREFARAISRDLAMHNPPAGLRALALGAETHAEEPAGAVGAPGPVAGAVGASVLDADDASAAAFVDVLAIPRGDMTRARFDFVLAGIKRAAREKRDKRDRARRVATYMCRMHARTEELHAEARATAGPSVGAMARGDDPVALGDAPTTRMNEAKFQRVMQNRLLDGSPNRSRMQQKMAARLSDVTAVRPILEDTTVHLERHVELVSSNATRAAHDESANAFGDALAATLVKSAKISRYMMYVRCLSVPLRQMSDLLGSHLAPDPKVALGTVGVLPISGLAVFVWLVMAGAHMLVKGGVSRSGVPRAFPYCTYEQFKESGYSYGTIEAFLSAVSGWSLCHGVADPRYAPAWRARIETAREYCRKKCDTSRTFRAGAYTVVQYATIISAMSPLSANESQAAAIMTLAMAFFLRVGEWILLDWEEVSFVKDTAGAREFLYVLFVLSKGDKHGDGVFRCATHRPHCTGCCEQATVVLNQRLHFHATLACPVCMLAFHVRRLHFISKANMHSGPVFRNPNRLDRSVPYGFLARVLRDRLPDLNQRLRDLGETLLEHVKVKDSSMRRTAATHAVAHGQVGVDTAMHQGRWKWLKTLELYIERVQAIKNAAKVLCGLNMLSLGVDALDAIQCEEDAARVNAVRFQPEAEYDLGRNLKPQEGLPFAKPLSDLAVQAKLVSMGIKRTTIASILNMGASTKTTFLIASEVDLTTAATDDIDTPTGTSAAACNIGPRAFAPVANAATARSVPWRDDVLDPLVQSKDSKKVKPVVVVQTALAYAASHGGTYPTAHEVATFLKKHTGDLSVRSSSVRALWPCVATLAQIITRTCYRCVCRMGSIACELSISSWARQRPTSHKSRASAMNMPRAMRRSRPRCRSFKRRLQRLS